MREVIYFWKTEVAQNNPVWIGWIHQNIPGHSAIHTQSKDGWLEFFQFAFCILQNVKFCNRDTTVIFLQKLVQIAFELLFFSKISTRRLQFELVFVKKYR
jgi:hypothetical protein